eukprot:3699329-Amphidinium_carterae.1
MDSNVYFALAIMEFDRLLTTVASWWLLGEVEAAALQVGDAHIHGEQLLGGHSWRVSGARFFAAKDLDLATIKALGRWGGSTVERYVGDAAIGTTVEAAKNVRVQHACCFPAVGVERALERRLFSLEKGRREGLH